MFDVGGVMVKVEEYWRKLEVVEAGEWAFIDQSIIVRTRRLRLILKLGLNKKTEFDTNIMIHHEVKNDNETEIDTETGIK